MLTLLQMIDYALGQAQLDSSFRPDARLWYNVVVNRLTDRFDYPFYRKKSDTTFLSGVKEYTLPSDFKRVDECYQIDSVGNLGAMIPLVDAYVFNQMNTGNISGPPAVAYIDKANNKIIFNAALSDSNGNGFRLFYYRKPNQVNLNGTDDNTVPDFEDQTTMMEALKAEAYEFRNDERYAMKKQEEKASLVEFQRNQYNDDSYSIIPLNAMNFRPNNRRLRGRGFRNG
jgi:hypothetical protein